MRPKKHVFPPKCSTQKYTYLNSDIFYLHQKKKIIYIFIFLNVIKKKQFSVPAHLFFLLLMEKSLKHQERLCDVKYKHTFHSNQSFTLVILLVATYVPDEATSTD